MKTFKITTDTEEFIVEAPTEWEAAGDFAREYFPEALDDELSDLFDIEELPDRASIRASIREYLDNGGVYEDLPRETRNKMEGKYL